MKSVIAAVVLLAGVGAVQAQIGIISPAEANRLYEGSWKEYASLKQYPAETEENKGR